VNNDTIALIAATLLPNFRRSSDDMQDPHTWDWMIRGAVQCARGIAAEVEDTDPAKKAAKGESGL
jgi:hypothetical protein